MAEAGQVYRGGIKLRKARANMIAKHNLSGVDYLPIPIFKKGSRVDSEGRAEIPVSTPIKVVVKKTLKKTAVISQSNPKAKTVSNNQQESKQKQAPTQRRTARPEGVCTTVTRASARPSQSNILGRPGRLPHLTKRLPSLPRNSLIGSKSESSLYVLNNGRGHITQKLIPKMQQNAVRQISMLQIGFLNERKPQSHEPGRGRVCGPRWGRDAGYKK